MIEIQEEKRSTGIIVMAALAALLVTAMVFGGYTLLRKRHAEDSASQAQASATPAPKPPKALVVVDEAMMQGGNTLIGGTVKNTSSDKLQQLVVELELRRRKDAGLESKTVALTPANLDPEQEGRYSVQLRAQDYSSAKLVGLKEGSAQTALAYNTALGQKRPSERLEQKTIVVGRPASKKGGEFLNSPDNPTRVP